MPSISDAFTAVTDKARAAILANAALDFGSIAKALYFMHGNAKEIMAVLQAQANAPATKNARFPLIALYRDIKEELTPGKFGLETKFRCKFGIFTLTEPSYRAAQREELRFKPILLPILEEMIFQIGRSELFGMPTVKDMGITKWDCYFYGSSMAKEGTQNPLNDFIDAIEVEISLKLKNICKLT